MCSLKCINLVPPTHTGYASITAELIRSRYAMTMDCTVVKVIRETTDTFVAICSFIKMGLINPIQEEPKKRFKCQECELTFAQERSLIRHDLAEHWKTIFSCACLKKFKRKDHLVRHQRNCTGQIKVGMIISTQNLEQQIPVMKPLPTTREFKFRKGPILTDPSKNVKRKISA